jgi:hypothetical protein
VWRILNDAPCTWTNNKTEHTYEHSERLLAHFCIAREPSSQLDQAGLLHWATQLQSDSRVAMAHLLAKLGKDALRPQNIGGVWRKAVVSAKNAARLRKDTLLDDK